MLSVGFSGVIAAVVTPFDEGGRVDVDALRAITNYLIEGGVHGIMTTGGTGEFPNLLPQERRLVTQTVVEEVKGLVPIIAGTAACGTYETILLTNDAAEAGAHAAIVVAPYYFPLPESSLEDHYRRVAEETKLPIVVYNNPSYTGNNLSPDLIARLAEVENIVGLKQSNADMGQFVEVVRLVDDRLTVMTGIDSQFYPSLCVGGRGIFSTAAGIVPRQMVDLYRAFLEGRHDEARELNLRLQALNRFLEYEPGYVSPCKEALNMLGLPGGKVRRPLPDLTPSERAGLAQALRELGALS